MKSPKTAKLSKSPSVSSNVSWLERHFHISRRGSSIGQEIRDGLVAFFAMAYIITLNPPIIGTAIDVSGNLISGAPKFLDEAMTQVDAAAVGASIRMVAISTAFIAGIMTIPMGMIDRLPMGLATGLGLSALTAYTLAPQMAWLQAMGLVVWKGILITILTLTGFRTAVFRAVPKTLRTAISVGIGLFAIFIGLINAGVVYKPTGSPPVELGISGSLAGWPIFVFVVGLGLSIALHVLKVKGAMLISTISATVMAIITETIGHVDVHVGVENPGGWALNVPSLTDFSLPNFGLLFRVDMIGTFYVDGHSSFPTFLGLMVLVFSLLLADSFDTMGTVVAIGSGGKLLDERGIPDRVTEALLVDSLGAVAGGLGSVSSNAYYVKLMAGVGEGARTSPVPVVIDLASSVAVFLSPTTNMVPSEAASPMPVFVGFLTIEQVVNADWDDPEVGVPVFLTIALMPFSYPITVDIGTGFLARAFIRVIHGYAKRVYPLMYVVVALFIIYLLQGPLLALIG